MLESDLIRVFTGTDTNLVGGDLLGPSLHLVFIYSQEKREIRINTDSISHHRTVMSGLRFCLSFSVAYSCTHLCYEKPG